MNIPILDLVRQYRTIRPEIDAAIRSVLDSGEFILGPHVKAFEDSAATYCRVRHAIGLASGTDALLLALKALGIGPGDAVLVPSFTFFATAGTVHNVGATPVFCDIDPKTFNIDPKSACEVLAARGSWPVACGKIRSSEATHDGKSPTGHGLHATGSSTGHRPALRAIIPVHLYGQMADMDEIMALAREYDLAVIEDAAQAIGAQYYGHVARGTWLVGKADEPVARNTWPVGTSGDPHAAGGPHATSYKPQAALAGSLGSLGCFSFYPTKNLGAYGDAGMVTTDSDELAEKIRLLRVHGAKPKYVHHVVGINSRLDAIQAAILSVKLQHLDEWAAARQQIADRYDRLLDGAPGIVTPYRAPGRTHIFHQYTVRVLDGRRDALAAHLKSEGIGTMVYYPGSLHLQECFAHLGCREGDFPESERASREVLSLPIFPELTETEQDRVVAAVRRFAASA